MIFARSNLKTTFELHFRSPLDALERQHRPQRNFDIARLVSATRSAVQQVFDMEPC